MGIALVHDGEGDKGSWRLPPNKLTRARGRARSVLPRKQAALLEATQRAGPAPPHAEGDRLSGATSDREFGFVSGPAAFVGGVPLTRAMNPWAMPEAST